MGRALITVAYLRGRACFAYLRGRPLIVAYLTAIMARLATLKETTLILILKDL